MNPIIEKAPMLILAIFAIVAVMASYRKATEVLENQLRKSDEDRKSLEARNRDLTSELLHKNEAEA